MLRPEMQDLDIFAEGIDNILITQKRVVEHYFHDGSVEAAVPPLKALLHIMRDGLYGDKDIQHPEIRALFTKEAVLGSRWYEERLRYKQRIEISLWNKHQAALKLALASGQTADPSWRQKLELRLATAEKSLARVSNADFWKTLIGTIGADLTDSL